MKRGAIKVVVCLFAVLCLICQSAAAERTYKEEYQENIEEINKMFFSEEQSFFSATGFLKPLPQVPENVTIIEASEIEAMHANTVYEVLERASGLFVRSDGRDFGSGAWRTEIHGAEPEQALVLIDGIRFNSLSSGSPDNLNGIPVRIIKRIEIIKGPASSTWGSSMGGVINIITKAPGSIDLLHGTVSASYGQGDSRQYHGEAYGHSNRVGYYFYAGRQDSDGHRDNRFFENNSFYAKVGIDLPKRSQLSLSLGSTAPDWNDGDFYKFTDYGFRGETKGSDLFSSATFDTPLTDNISLNLSLHFSTKRQDVGYQALDPLSGNPTGEPSISRADGSSHGGSGRLVWKGDKQTAALGIEYDRGKLDQSYHESPVHTVYPTSKEERLAVYLNDTLSLGKLTLVPGIRYDRHSVTSDFVSPSLGATYQVTDDTLVRASIARGFNSPTLTEVAPSPWGDGNPDLDPYTIMSYQTGVESKALKWLRLKASLFLDEVDDFRSWDDDKGFFVNAADSRRRGFEIEAETAPFHHFSINANYSYAHVHSPESEPDFENHVANLVLNYDNPKIIKAQLYGHYIYSSRYDNDVFPNGSFDTLWDFNLSKVVFSNQDADVELFCTIRNLFDASQYWTEEYANPDRWVEVGLRILM